jgi:predicted nucleic acid-binding protein
VSAVSYVEVLGYHRLTETERRYFEAFFAEARVLPLSKPVIDEAVRLRQAKKIKLGDSLVAGTALLHDLTLVTRNVDDFNGIDSLRVLNPFAEPGASPTS